MSDNNASKNLAVGLRQYSRLLKAQKRVRKQLDQLRRSIVMQKSEVARLRFESQKELSDQGLPILKITAKERSPIYPDFCGSPLFSLSLCGPVFEGRSELNWNAQFDHDGNHPNEKDNPLTLVYKSLYNLLYSAQDPVRPADAADVRVVTSHFGIGQLYPKVVWRGEVYYISEE